MKEMNEETEGIEKTGQNVTQRRKERQEGPKREKNGKERDKGREGKFERRDKWQLSSTSEGDSCP